MPKTVSLSDALAEYERSRISNHIAKSTIRNNRTTLNKFLAVTGNIWVHSIDDRHVGRFFEELAKTKQAQSMRNDHTALQGFFKWAKHKRYMSEDNDPMWGRRKPPRNHKERNRVHVSKFPALLDAAEERCERDRAGIAMLLYTLARDQEIANVQIRDVDLASGEIHMRIYKTGQEDLMPICEELDQELRQWLTYYTQQVGPLEPHYYLIPSRDTRGVRGEDGIYHSVTQVRLCPERKVSTLGRLASPALEKIGFPIRDANGRPMGEGAHTIRRSGARALFDRLVLEGFDGALRIVQSMLHHASVTTTEQYLGLTADRYKRDTLIRGKRLYDTQGVVNLRSVANGEEAGHPAVL